MMTLRNMRENGVQSLLFRTFGRDMAGSGKPV
jgi:hypothetical protein